VLFSEQNRYVKGEADAAITEEETMAYINVSLHYLLLFISLHSFSLFTTHHSSLLISFYNSLTTYHFSLLFQFSLCDSSS